MNNKRRAWLDYVNASHEQSDHYLHKWLRTLSQEELKDLLKKTKQAYGN